MANYDTWYNLLTGLSQGAFDVLEVRAANGVMTNILTLLGNSGSGITDVQVSAPLTVASSGTVRTVGINLGSYSTTAQTQVLLNGKQNTLTAGASISIVGNTISFDASLWLNAVQISLMFTAYTPTSTLTTLLAGKENTITAGNFLTKTGSTLDVNLSAYTPTSTLTTLLAAKENTITAGNF